MTAAIFYQHDGYSTAGPALMGRNAAGESFLRGFVQYTHTERFSVYAATTQAAQPFVDTVRGAGRHEPIDIIQRQAIGALRQPGTLYFPASNIGQRARERSLVGRALWSICGVTHTTASTTATDGITDLLTGAVEPWDAVICPSQAVRANVEAVLQAEMERLTARLGATRFALPQLPIIPLGIHTGDYARDDAARAAARAALGADEDTAIILYVGRLSFHAKAHPAAMYAALEAAKAQAGTRRVMLIECGWFANDTLKDSFDAAAAALCPSVELVRLDGRQADLRARAWAAADIFCSLADNFQETFGLTPLEAMAAGLPVVVSDWDGYRDTVRHGIDGYRIPTVAPAAGLGGDLAGRLALELDTYDFYCGYSAMFVSVDIPAATEAFATLLASPERRREMGAAGQARARAEYDWRTIIPRYEALWSELAAIRGSAGTAAQPATPWPARMDPFRSFASYPTLTLTHGTRVALVAISAEAANDHVERMGGLFMFSFASAVLAPREDIAAMIVAISAGATTAGEAVAGLPEARRAGALRTLAWLAKIGVISLSDGSG